MRLKVPITGTVLDINPITNTIVGDDNDRVRPLSILGNVSWRLITIDLENDLAEIEVSPGKYTTILKDGGDPANEKDWITRLATEEEKQGFLDYAKSIIEGHTKDELYEMSKMKRLVKSEEVMRKYRKK